MPIAIDDVITGALVNVLALAGRRLSVAAADLTRRTGQRDLDIARWFETFRLTAPPSLAQRLAPVIQGDEFQAALHELLAARLTDAAEIYPAQARAVLCRTLIADGASADAADDLAGYYDDQICRLVARLEADEPAVLAQIRGEALATRMINILHAIERHAAALAARPDWDIENYRRHVITKHGHLEPPDFQRRRPIPIDRIYVPTAITEELSAERTGVSPHQTRTLDAWGLATRLDRTVLLGDPGGGKTTASNVLMHHFASNPAGPIPFLVTLREYAAQDPPERSVAAHIEHTLDTLYQCPAPPGVVEGLLLSARAVVIFDGLDELLDTSRRADVSSRVEQFCIQYPQAPVLVTSRLIGYDQARLDDSQFTCYRLGGFAGKQVGEYAEKWFALAEGTRPGDVTAFLDESVSVPDLRTNPLLLSLLCILYRGAGTLPQDRDEVYEKCADLLIRDWDDYRRIRRELRVGRKVKPLLRQLAWWLFTRSDGATAVTERELIRRTTGLLRDSFETDDDARDAAREFIAFCHDRMWVFTYAGTTATGAKLYAFTHRTFLEFFAAAQLAADTDSPEQLAAAIAPRVAAGEWPVVTELAVQIKDRASTNGAARVYGELLGYGGDFGQRARVLEFLATCLRSVDPTPARVRELTRLLFLECVESLRGTDHHIRSAFGEAFAGLFVHCGTHRDSVAAEISAVTTNIIRAGEEATIENSIWMLSSFDPLTFYLDQPQFWTSYARDLLRANAASVIRAAESYAHVRRYARLLGLITLGQALDMDGGLDDLVQGSEDAFDTPWMSPLHDTASRVWRGWRWFGTPEIADDLAAIGEYLTRHPELPWFDPPARPYRSSVSSEAERLVSRLSPEACLGAIALLTWLVEAEPLRTREPRLGGHYGPLNGLHAYVKLRALPAGSAVRLPDLPVPAEFKQVFRDWANGLVNVTMTPERTVDQR